MMLHIFIGAIILAAAQTFVTKSNRRYRPAAIGGQWIDISLFESRRRNTIGMIYGVTEFIHCDIETNIRRSNHVTNHSTLSSKANVSHTY
jgi:hypothetical protein